MQDKKIVFQIRKVVEREEDGETIIFEKKEDGWVYHAANAQDHTIENLETILEKLKELEAKG
jgi:K+/H+ antiporter YhaU regulatory subunit KhtT